MSKMSGMGSKKSGSHQNETVGKNMDKCTGKHTKKCGKIGDLSDKHAHDKKHKHSYMDMDKNIEIKTRLDDL